MTTLFFLANLGTNFVHAVRKFIRNGMAVVRFKVGEGSLNSPKAHAGPWL